MVKINVVSLDGQKDDLQKKSEALPEQDFFRIVPLYNVTNLEEPADLTKIKNTKRRSKGLMLFVGLILLAVIVFLALLALTTANNKKAEEVKIHRFTCEILFRDPDDQDEDTRMADEQKVMINIAINIQISKQITSNASVAAPLHYAKTSEHETSLHVQTATTDASLVSTTLQSNADGTSMHMPTHKTSDEHMKLASTHTYLEQTTEEYNKHTHEPENPITGNPTTTAEHPTTTEHLTTTERLKTTEKLTTNEEKSTIHVVTQRTSTIDSYVHHMEEEIVVDIENNTEVFNIPRGEDHEMIEIIHDFSYAMTAYYLVDHDICFVKPISRYLMTPYRFCTLLRNPLYFLFEFIITRETYIATVPPMEDISNFGTPIVSMCGHVPTFWLDKLNTDDDDREIVEITELPWSDWGYAERSRRRRSATQGLKHLNYYDSDAQTKKMYVKFAKNPTTA